MDHDETRQLEELRRAIRVGIDQAVEGRLSPLNEEMVERIKADGRKRLAAERLTRSEAQDRFESKSLQFVYDRCIGKDPAREASFEEELANTEVARRIYDLRTEAGLTQRELAERMDTKASVISRLEDADYDGHSLAMLKRVAAALGKRLEIRFIALKESPNPA